MKPIESKEQFIELRAEGRSYADIATTLNVSKPTLMQWSRELQDDLVNARAIRTDELFEKFAVSKSKRIEFFGKRLALINAELDKRKLTGVKTAELLKLVLDYGDRLKEEEIPLVLQGAEEMDDVLVRNSTTTWRA